MRAGRAGLALALLVGALVPSVADAGPRPCGHRVLVLSAMPLELNPLVAQANLERTVRVDGRTFYLGRLAGVDVALALTGIGPVNATETATAAFEHLGCSFDAAVFSGVAGSVSSIGDVVVPQRWTADGGTTFLAVDPALYALAGRLPGLALPLSQDVPVGDAACLCGGVDAATPVHLPQRPQVRVGGVGETSDPFGGSAAPCTYGGGDIAGCEPCVLSGDPAADTETFAGNAPELPALLTGMLAPPPTTTTTAAAQDQETAAVAVVARRFAVPFLGLRGVSDGPGDPLGLPGFPAQFAVYRQLAGNNAAVATTAFLRLWGGRS